MILSQLRFKSIQALKPISGDCAEYEVDQLLKFVFGWKTSDIVLKLQEPISDEDRGSFDRCLQRRLNQEPLDLILGTTCFYKHEYSVNKGVLLPRPETEILVESLVAYIPQILGVDFIGLECGFGTGIISIELALCFKKSNWISFDTSMLAYDCAKTNALNLKCMNVDWMMGDFFDLENRFEDISKPICLVSNPPYIPTHDISKLDNSVVDYDPLTALDGGVDGLVFYRQLFDLANRVSNIKIVGLECGINQHSDVTDIATDAGFELFRCVKDYHGIERVLILVRS